MLDLYVVDCQCAILPTFKAAHLPECIGLAKKGKPITLYMYTFRCRSKEEF